VGRNQRISAAVAGGGVSNMANSWRRSTGAAYLVGAYDIYHLIQQLIMGRTTFFKLYQGESSPKLLNFEELFLRVFIRISLSI
jgi:hypothetical protein